jgi:putative membrane protein
MRYLRMAGAGDLFEVQSSRLALQRSRNPEVRRFARMMITDHTRSTQMIMRAARRAGVAPRPAALAPDQAATMRRLRAAPARRFDAAYGHAQSLAHTEALALHQGYAETGDIRALRSVAGEVAGVVRTHLGHVRQLPGGA